MKNQHAVIEAVGRAARLCQHVQSEMVQADSLEKEDRSPVTVADFGSQAIVCGTLRQLFPDDPIVAEEDASVLRQNRELRVRVTRYVSRYAGSVTPQDVCSWIDEGNGDVGNRFWTLDPIDGTKGFLRGEQYAIALALVVDGQVAFSVLACPNLPLSLTDPESPVGCLFIAEMGQGTRMRPLGGDELHSVTVSDNAERFAESFVSAHSDQSTQQAIASHLGITEPPIRMDSQAKYALVARGDAAIYLRLPNPATPDYRECIWDHAAGMLVVQEAGGRVTDAEGKMFDLLAGKRMASNRGVIVTNGTLHERVLEAVRMHG